jgi:ABC-type sugar transport system ATPase subunit
VIVMHEGKITGELKASELTEDRVMYYATNLQAGDRHGS